ncbi:hypothetical protein ACFLX8_00380 [Chloroflexota bacterium]
MPGKSQHGKRKHSFQSKKGKGKRNPLGVVAQRQADTQGEKSVAPPKVVAPSTSTPTPLTTVQYPYVLTELRRIGILAGIMLAILVVLALILS